jgi:phage baseplate assembly protein W
MADRPHLAWPFARGIDGNVLVVEQDEAPHIDACCQVIIRCPVGFRPERPEFGWQFPEFRNVPLDTANVTEAIKRWEPRATNVTAYEYADAAADAVRHISIDVGVA